MFSYELVLFDIVINVYKYTSIIREYCVTITYCLYVHTNVHSWAD